MSPEKALPLETLIPYPQVRPQESISDLRTALNQANEDAEDDSGQDDDVSDSGKPNKRPKRARACISCRNMKIRCLPVEGQDSCLSCSKVNRDCVMPGPARKRQKTVHKVAELEKKINALTDALLAKNQANPTPPGDSPISPRLDTQSDVTRTSTTAAAPDTLSYDTGSTNPQTFGQSGVLGGNFAAAQSKRDMNFCPVGPTVPPEPYVDIIDRGILDMDTAAAMFNHYVSTLRPYFPVVSFPPYVKACDVRTARPMVFLAILAITSAAVRPDLQQDLVTEISRQLSERVMFMGEKSLELVQSMLLYTAYYVRSKQAKDLAFNQYIHAAVVMCLDLGMGKKYPPRVIHNEAEDGEVRRTWLGCYYFALNVSILLRHPSLVRWSSYLEESVEVFSRPTASPDDRWLACLCSMVHIMEEVSIVFSMDDPTATISFAEAKTHYHLKVFERQLAQWRPSVPPGMDKRLVDHLYSCASLYIHEIAIHHDHNIDDFKAGAVDTTYQPTGSFVTTAHVDALTACLDSSQRVLNSYLKLDLETCRSIPNLVIVWNTYAEVALIKLHGVLHAPDSPFGSIFTPDLKVEYYLDAVTRKLQEVAVNGRWPPAEAFVFITKKLRSWHSLRCAPNFDEVNATIGSEPQTTQEQAEGTANFLMKPGRPRIPETWGLTQPQGQSGESLAAPNAVGAVDAEMFGASQTSDMNAAFNAANYNIDWSEMSFSQDELNVFDSYMNDQGWMGYLI